jgi:hypothetical protein
MYAFETPEDLVTIARLVPHQINTDLAEKDCIEVIDIDEKWLLCTNDPELLKKMTCAVQTLLGQKCEE